MLDKEFPRSIATQMMAGNAAIQVQGKSVPIRRTSSQHLKMIKFNIADRGYTAIEQNPEKPSRWGQLAREGHQVVQFKDDGTNRFVAVAVDGEVKEYGGRQNNL